MNLRLGIDIGSTTVKLACLDADKQLLFSAYERHYARARARTVELLRAHSTNLAGAEIQVALTGSVAVGLADESKLPFVQEVFATARAVSTYLPDTDAVIELGGEDAKVIFFGNNIEERMNGSCAGGTGAFIDQMASLLDVSNQELDALSCQHETIYPIASRCGVFAKSDIQPILNQGGRKSDLAASIFQAVVDQTIAGLCQGRTLKGKLVFLGGPLHFLQGLRQRFVETLQLDEDNAIFPEDGACFAAIGAALCSDAKHTMTLSDLLTRLENIPEANCDHEGLPPLFASEDEYIAFQARHEGTSLPSLPLKTYTGKAYLGIDAGSTTTKLMLITPDAEVLYQHYQSNRGNPVAVVLEQLRHLRQFPQLDMAGVAVTGYGEDLIQHAFCCDMGLVETLAHYKAAQHYDPQVDFIIDIGGQDMKCFKIRKQAVDSILLNEACSSGCGSFIETFARAMGYDIADFARLGLFAKKPVNLGSRCTVFMNSSVKQAQKEGASVADISAGLSISVVKNAIYKVIRAKRPEDLGTHIVVQGGTFLNDAVLRAFEQDLGCPVTRPQMAGLMGAFGAALAVRDAKILDPTPSTLLDANTLQHFAHAVKSRRCGLCQNHCALTVNQFSHTKQPLISGNRCSRPLGKPAEQSLPNLYQDVYEHLRMLEGKGKGTGARGRIGIPLVLNLFETLPFWFAFFTALDFEVRLSPPSSRTLYRSAQTTIPSDTVCYPAKLTHAHAQALAEQDCTAIFYPCMSYNFDEGTGDNHYHCPVVAYYPELLHANVPNLQETPFLHPYVGLHRPQDFTKRAIAYCRAQFGIGDKKAVKRAVQLAYTAYEQFQAESRQCASQAIAYARQHALPILVLAGRPYHLDPEINHGIHKLMSSFGFVVLTEQSLSHLLPAQPRKVLNQWTYHSRLYQAARYVCTQDDMQFVHLVSFGCGIDAITSDELRDILEAQGKLYTQLKIDDISNLGAVKIRLRSLMAAMGARLAQKEVFPHG